MLPVLSSLELERAKDDEDLERARVEATSQIVGERSWLDGGGGASKGEGGGGVGRAAVINDGGAANKLLETSTLRGGGGGGGRVPASVPGSPWRSGRCLAVGLVSFLNNVCYGGASVLLPLLVAAPHADLGDISPEDASQLAGLMFGAIGVVQALVMTMGFARVNRRLGQVTGATTDDRTSAAPAVAARVVATDTITTTRPHPHQESPSVRAARARRKGSTCDTREKVDGCHTLWFSDALFSVVVVARAPRRAAPRPAARDVHCRLARA